MTSYIDFITPHNFLIFVGCIVVFYGIAFLKKQSIEENNSEKVLSTQDRLPKYDVKLFDFKINNGLVLIILGMILQMFAVSHIPENKNDIDKTIKKNNIEDDNQSEIITSIHINNTSSAICSEEKQPILKPTNSNKIIKYNQKDCNGTK